MSKQQPIRDGLREAFIAVKNAILPSPGWPESELPLIRHTPMDDDSDSAYWSDRVYIEQLKNEIFDCVRDGAFLWEMPALVWSERLYSEMDWPHDEAAMLLTAWRIAAQQEEAA